MHVVCGQLFSDLVNSGYFFSIEPYPKTNLLFLNLYSDTRPNSGLNLTVTLTRCQLVLVAQ